MKKFFAVLMCAAMAAGTPALIGQAQGGTSAEMKSTAKIENLKTDSLSNPVGIDSEAPLFSWNLEDAETRGQKQTAYRIVAAESEQMLENGEYVWDTGEVLSDETANIAYDGETLSASTRYFWRVEIKDRDGKTAVSDTAFFETGLMSSGWSGAQWIAKTDAVNSGFYDITDFTIDLDFKIVKNTASFVFGAQNTGDLYMWQISNSTNVGSDTYFRPHKCTGGGWNNYSNKTVASGKTWGTQDFVHMTIEAKGGTIKTYFGGTLFDTHTQTPFKLGYIGFRKPSDEEMIFDNIVVKDGSGEVIYSEDFSDGKADGFDGLTVTDGAADLTGTDNCGTVLRYGEKKEESAPMFRKEFTVDGSKTVEKARLYITSAGIYRAFVNGENVTDSYLNPGMTAYDDHIMYQTYDITELLQSGKNAVGVYLGHGWWDRALRNFGTRLHIYAKILVEYDDGTSETVVTDSSWKFYRYGPIKDDDIFNGFKFDGTVEEALDGWNKPNFDDSKWESVKVSAANEIVSNKQTPKIIAQNIPLIKNTITLDAVSVTEPKEGVYVYDFGQNIAGVARITAAAPKGTKVTLRHAEVLNRDKMSGADDEPGMIFTANLPRADATDTYVFKGDPNGETFEPFFSYHGFRYLEITGLDEPIPLENVKALLIMSDLEQTSEFTSSNALVNRLYLNSLWSARDNFLSVPTDCPQRGERFGWTGDAQIFARTGSYMMDVNAFYQKYCMDMRDTSTNNRIIADVSPASVGNGWYGQGDRKGATNGWGDAIVIIPYQMYKQYGNRRILEENYETMCNWMDYLVSTSTDYVRDQSWTGDWLCVTEPKSPVALTDTAFCAYSASLISEIAEILDKPDDAKKYGEIYNNYRNAWRDNFLESDGCTTKCGTQTSYVLGIKFGLFDEDEMDGAAENLVKNIKSHNWHLTTGFLGLSYLNPTLSDAGYTEAAYRLLEQTEYPSWLYSVTTGATSIWESWYVMRVYDDGSSSINEESHNHFSYGAVSEWLFRDVLGIERDDENSNSFKHFILKPEFGGTFTYANGSYNSIRGKIESGWKLDRATGKFTYKAVVPANTTATLYLPSASADSAVYEGGVSADKAEGVEFVQYKNGYAVYELESGSYEFVSTADVSMNDISSVKLTNNQKISAKFTAGGKTYSDEQVYCISSEPIKITAECLESGYAFCFFRDGDGKTYPNGTSFSGDVNIEAVFAYTGSDDGNENDKKITLTGDKDIKIKVNGTEQTLPYTGTFAKGEFVEIEVISVPFGKGFSDIGGLKGVENTVCFAPYSNIEAKINLSAERYRKGYDVFFDFNKDIDGWSGSNVDVTYEPGYMRFKAKIKSDGTYDPRVSYDFSSSGSITGGKYLEADKYGSIIIGFIADSVGSNSTPYMYISTEAQPSYINPVRGKAATSQITVDMADGKTLREVEYKLSGWPAWTGNIKQVYFDILDNVDGNLRVDYIKFKHRDIKLTVKTSDTDVGTVYGYMPGTAVDLSELEVGKGFKGYSLTLGSTDYITEIELKEDTVIYANYSGGAPAVKRNAIVWDFDDNTLQGWTAVNAKSAAAANGAAKVVYKTDNADAYFYKGGVNADASSYKYVVVTLRHNVPAGKKGSKPFEVFFRKTTDSWGQHLSVNGTLLSASDDYKTYIFDMSKCSGWYDTIDYIRIDPFEAKSPSDAEYFFEADKIMLCEEAYITFDPAYDGAQKTTEKVPACIDVNLSDYGIPKRDGYRFVGWSDGENGVLTKANTGYDITLYAVWEKEKPEIVLEKSKISVKNCSGILAAASYDGERLIDVKLVSVSGEKTVSFDEIGLKTEGADNVRAFAFESMTSPKPLCESKIIKF